MQALRSFLRGSLQVIIQGEDPTQAMQGALKSTVTGAFGAYLAGEIGKAYKGGYGTIDPLTHKLLHGLLGGGLGAIISDNPAQGALSGALGAMIAETVADMMTEHPDAAMTRMVKEEKAKGKNLTVKDYLKAYNKHVHRNMDVARIIAAFSAVLLNTDVNVAHHAAQNAVENNCYQAIAFAAVAIEEMLVALGITTSAILTPMLIEKFNKMYSEYQRNKGEGYDAENDEADLNNLNVAKNAADKKASANQAAPSVRSNASSAMPPQGPDWEPEDHEGDKNSAKKAEQLKEQLAKEQQTNEPGTIMVRGGEKFRDASKYVDQYGGEIQEWVKKSSSSYLRSDGIKIETHWVENLNTGQRVDIKIKEIVSGFKGQ